MPISPQSARIKFGSEVRRAREQAGLTQNQLAKAVRLVQSHISAIEKGKKGTTAEQVHRLNGALSADGSLERRWHDLHTRQGGYADWFQGTAVLERSASEIQINSPLLVPGLLQTESYARTIIRYGARGAASTEVEEQVQARMDRQEVLTSDRGPLVTAVIDESVLQRPLGGRDIMRTQLDYLLEVSRFPRVTVHVIEMTSEYHPGLDGTFHLFTVPGQGQVLYTENRIDGHPVDDSAGVSEYVSVFGELRGVAQPAVASRELMKKIRREFDD